MNNMTVLNVSIFIIQSLEMKKQELQKEQNLTIYQMNGFAQFVESEKKTSNR